MHPIVQNTVKLILIIFILSLLNFYESVFFKEHNNLFIQEKSIIFMEIVTEEVAYYCDPMNGCSDC